MEAKNRQDLIREARSAVTDFIKGAGFTFDGEFTAYRSVRIALAVGITLQEIGMREDTYERMVSVAQSLA